MKKNNQLWALLVLALLCVSAVGVHVRAQDDAEDGEAAPSAAADAAAAAPADATLEGFTQEQMEQLSSKAEHIEFQTEVSRLMDIIINSLYSNREVFLRELISNASDALDKIRFLSLTDKDQLGANPELDIRVWFDKERRTLTVADSGCGMTKRDLIDHLGTVASSGTSRFVEAAATNKDALSLIGQFGVGFYSVYLVADRVTVVTKSNADETQWVWQSAADKTFSVTPDPRGNTLGRGTHVTLHLKADASEFLDETTLRRIVGKYSEFINFPILLQEVKTVTEEVPVEEEATPADADAEKKTEDDVAVSDEEDASEKKPKTKSVQKEVREWKQVNENKAIWTRDASSITEEEYASFYKALTKDSQGPLQHVHFVAEGEISFKAILFVPEVAPHNLYQDYHAKSNSLKLYVRKVLISEEFEDFMPRYLSFIRGVVDSEDLPLNVSRETLSKSRVLRVMGKKLTRKALDMLREMADAEEDEDTEEEEEAEKEADAAAEEDEEAKAKKEAAKAKKEADAKRYGTFFKQFGKSIKLGVLEDKPNQSKLQKLLRFPSSKSEEKLTSLSAYVDRMKDGQESIFYITGESVEQVRRSPFVERVQARGYEVLYLVDPLDEYLVQSMPDYDGKKLVSVSKEGLKFGDESDDEKAREQRYTRAYKPLAAWLKKVYGDRVEKVVVSNRMEKSPCALVTSQYGWSANMERIMKAQAFANAEQAKYMVSKKTMEINPRHPMIQRLAREIASRPDDSKLVDMAELMYDSMLLASGFVHEDVHGFSNRITRVLGAGLDVDADAPIEDDAELLEKAAAEEAKEAAEKEAAKAGKSKSDATEEEAVEAEDDQDDSERDEL